MVLKRSIPYTPVPYLPLLLGLEFGHHKAVADVKSQYSPPRSPVPRSAIPVYLVEFRGDGYGYVGTWAAHDPILRDLEALAGVVRRQAEQGRQWALEIEINRFRCDLAEVTPDDIAADKHDDA